MQRVHTLVHTRIPKKCAAVRERIIGPVLQVHIIRSLGNYGIEIQVPYTTMKD